MKKRLTTDTAEMLAMQMRSTLRAGSCEPLNMKTILRQLRVMAVYRPLSEELWGLSLKTSDGNHRFMLINSNVTRGSQHFTIAHELFHLYYDEEPRPHFCGQEMMKDSSERNANLFASALLMPREGLVANLPVDELTNKEVSIGTALRLEQLYGVSHTTFVVRLKELNMVSPSCTDRLMNVSIRREAAMSGLDGSLYQPGNKGLIIGDFGAKARKLFEEERISEGHYLELLNMIGYGESEDSAGC
ncbi:MAG: ImmA/IrrE family metallo-endopeptidase [Paludibacteraceae bacterium]|nr:ImmA/IrrE family metallo-endopeptidase [Paludibacteraceae bacterium]